MKKSMKIFLVLFLIIAIITGITRIVYADNNYSCNLEITQDKTTIAPEDTVSFQLKASNIQIGNAGMILLQITVEDDNGDITENFKCTASGDEDNVWSLLANFEGEITFNKQDYDEPVGSESVIGKINLKANKDLQEGIYTIKFKGITFNTTDDQQISIPDITKTIEVKTSSGGGSSSGGNTSSGDNSQGGNTSSGDNSQGGNTSSGDNSQGGNTSSGDNSQGGNTSSGDNSQGGSTSSGDNLTPGGSTSSGDGLTPGGSTSSGDGLTPEGSTSSGDSLTPGGSASSDDSSVPGGSSSSTGDSSNGVYNSSSTTKKATDSSNNKSNLPYAGETSNTVKILIIIALVALSICLFAKYKWLNI